MPKSLKRAPDFEQFVKVLKRQGKPDCITVLPERAGFPASGIWYRLLRSQRTKETTLIQS